MKFLFLVPGIGMIAVGFFAILWWKKQSSSPAFYYLLGCFAWIAGVAMKVVFAIAFNSKVNALVHSALKGVIADIIYYVYIGLLTGIFECGTVLLLIFLIKQLQKQTFEDAVSFGIAFGAVEAVLLGLASLVSVGIIIFVPGSVPPATANAISVSKLWTIPSPIIERFSAIFIHTFSAALIIYAFLKKEYKWFWLSFFYKTVVDSLAAWVAIKKLTETPLELYWVEFEFFLLAFIGLIGLKILKNNWPKISEGEESVNPVPQE